MPQHCRGGLACYQMNGAENIRIMTQTEISQRLMRLKYEGGWTLSALAKEIGFDRDTVRRAVDGDMSDTTQRRIEAVLKIIAPSAPPPPPKKHKPGKMKRFLIRYYNLMKWCNILEREAEIKKKYSRPQRFNMTREVAGYVCSKLDYIMKRYLMDVFGTELKRRKISMGDCMAAEQWVLHIKKRLPQMKQDLIKKLLIRKDGFSNDRR